MTAAQIREAILSNSWQGKAAGEIAELLNAPQVVRGEYMIGVGSVLNVLGATAGAALLDQVKALAETDSVVRYGWMLLEKASLDVGLDSTRAMLDALLPVEAATLLKGLAEQTVTAGITWEQVRDALEGM